MVASAAASDPASGSDKAKAAIDWSSAKATLRERTYHQLERVFGIADIRSRVLCEELITPDDWRAERINHGATFNLAHSLSQMLHRRPHHRLQGFDGLWLVGGGTHPGSGLPVIFLSAQTTSRMLCEEVGIDCPLDAGPPTSTVARDEPLLVAT